MSRFSWRVLFVILFIPFGLPVLLWSCGVLVVASFAWMARGQRQVDGRDRVERWSCGRIGDALDRPLDKLMRKAEVLREFWTD